MLPCRRPRRRRFLSSGWTAPRSMCSRSGGGAEDGFEIGRAAGPRTPQQRFVVAGHQTVAAAVRIGQQPRLEVGLEEAAQGGAGGGRQCLRLLAGRAPEWPLRALGKGSAGLQKSRQGGAQIIVAPGRQVAPACRLQRLEGGRCWLRWLARPGCRTRLTHRTGRADRAVAFWCFAFRAAGGEQQSQQGGGKGAEAPRCKRFTRRP